MIAKYLPLLIASMRRKPLRLFFTLASIVVAFLLFGLAESLRYSLQSGVDVAGADRLITMHKVSFTQLLPMSYENRIRAVDGVADVTPQTWFGAWYQDERNQLPTFPVDPDAFLRMYPEYQMPEDQRLAWLADRAGIMIPGASGSVACPRPAAGRRSRARSRPRCRCRPPGARSSCTRSTSRRRAGRRRD